MSDIVEQLRTRGGWFSSDGTFFQTAKTMLTAADEIETLRQRVARLERKVQLYESITTEHEHERVEAVLLEEAGKPSEAVCKSCGANDTANERYALQAELATPREVFVLVTMDEYFNIL